MEKTKNKLLLFWGIGKTILLVLSAILLSYEDTLALQPPAPPQENSSLVYFAKSSSNKQVNDDDGDISGSARSGSRSAVSTSDSAFRDDAEEDEEEQQRDLATAFDDLPGQQLEHSKELPFGDYFIDTRIVGAVRYHADFSLDTEFDILRELSYIQKDLKHYLAIPDPKETIEVFFFQSDVTYWEFLYNEFPKAPTDRRALYIKNESGPGMVLTVNGPDLKEDLRHEMTHAFLHAAIPYVPLWLDEGLAEYFEKPRDTRALSNSYFKEVTRKTTFGQVPSISRLEKMIYFDQMGNTEYREAWSWVHFMLHHSRQTHLTLAGYLQLLAKNGKNTPPLEGYLAKAVPDLKKSYVEHFRDWKNRPNVDARATAQSTYNKPPVPKDETVPEKEQTGTRMARGWTESLLR